MFVLIFSYSIYLFLSLILKTTQDKVKNRPTNSALINSMVQFTYNIVQIIMSTKENEQILLLGADCDS